jgi:predicted transcriptional regulator of viral defense system
MVVSVGKDVDQIGCTTFQSNIKFASTLSFWSPLILEIVPATNRHMKDEHDDFEITKEKFYLHNVTSADDTKVVATLTLLKSIADTGKRIVWTSAVDNEKENNNLT